MATKIAAASGIVSGKVGAVDHAGAWVEHPTEVDVLDDRLTRDR
jgi:hypothetical protein